MPVKSTILIAFLVILSLILGPGIAWVEVQEHTPDGVHLWLPIPISFAKLGIAFAPREEMSQAAAQVRPYLPAIEAACNELGRIPDMVLVEVKDHEDNVRIEKRGSSIYVDVFSGTDEVHVSFPIRAAASIVGQIARIGDSRS